VLRQALQDNLDAHAATEPRLSELTGADQVVRRRAEPGHGLAHRHGNHRKPPEGTPSLLTRHMCTYGPQADPSHSVRIHDVRSEHLVVLRPTYTRRSVPPVPCGAGGRRVDGCPGSHDDEGERRSPACYRRVGAVFPMPNTMDGHDGGNLVPPGSER
jgi:hypothetical protein